MSIEQRGALSLTTPPATYHLAGLVQERLLANMEQWLLVAPQANPGMLQMMRDREQQPRRSLVPWAGEFAGKYLTAAVLAWRLGHDGRLYDQIQQFVEQFIATQSPDGYLGPFPQHERLVGRTLDGREATWDLWGHYHAILGLLSWYQGTGYEPALAACVAAADYVCERLLDSVQRVIDAGAEEMNMAISHGLCLLYQETGNPRYLRLVQQIESEWETPPAGNYLNCALQDVPFYLTPKPRWESLHDIQTLLSLYEITGDSRYRRAFEQIWRSILATDIHNTGGFTSGEQATGNPYDPRAIETCCTVSWMVLSVDMLRLTGESGVADELERSFYNAALGAQTPSGRWWTYNTPMDGVRLASAHDIVFQSREGTPELNCCSVNGPRSLGLLCEWALMAFEGGLALNYYGPGQIETRLADGSPVSLTQETDYPVDGHIRIRLGLEQPASFDLKLRIPFWSQQTTVCCQGEALPTPIAGGYLSISRQWRDGDLITIDLEMKLRLEQGAREAEGKVSLYRGPLLLAYDRRYDGIDPAQLPALALAEAQPEIVAWSGEWPQSWLLLRLPTVDGGQITLCDFCSAGNCGTPYRSWLPWDGSLSE